MSRRSSDNFVRLSLRLSTEVKAQLEEMRERSRAESLTEVIRHALMLYDTLLDEKEAGRTFVVRSEDGKEREVMLIF